MKTIKIVCLIVPFLIFCVQAACCEEMKSNQSALPRRQAGDSAETFTPLEVSELNRSSTHHLSSVPNHLELLTGFTETTDSNIENSDLSSDAGQKKEMNFHIVVKGDTLWHIAGNYLGRPTRWPEIWNFNKSTIKNPNLIYPNQKVFLSKLPEETGIPVQKEEVTKVAENIPSQEEESSEKSQEIQRSQGFQVLPEAESESNMILKEIGKIATIQKKIKPSAKLSDSISGKIIMEVGDEIVIKFKKSQTFPPGTIFTVFRQREAILDSDGYLMEEDSTIIETIGAVELIKSLSSRKSLAKVVAVSAPLEKGDSLRLWEENSK